jgi:hypothetical protein
MDKPTPFRFVHPVDFKLGTRFIFSVSLSARRRESIRGSTVSMMRF